MESSRGLAGDLLPWGEEGVWCFVQRSSLCMLFPSWTLSRRLAWFPGRGCPPVGKVPSLLTLLMLGLCVLTHVDLITTQL